MEGRLKYHTSFLVESESTAVTDKTHQFLTAEMSYHPTHCFLLQNVVVEDHLAWAGKPIVKNSSSTQ